MRGARCYSRNNKTPTGQNERDIKMAVKRHQSNIVNIAFTIETEDGKAGVEVSQAIVNGKSAGCGFRTINGARKSAQIRLDRACLEDLREALNEILEQEFMEE